MLPQTPPTVINPLQRSFRDYSHHRTYSGFRRCHHCNIDIYDINLWKEHVNSREHLDKVRQLSAGGTGLIIANGSRFNVTDNTLMKNEETCLNQMNYPQYSEVPQTAGNGKRFCDKCNIELENEQAWLIHIQHPGHLHCKACDLTMADHAALTNHLENPNHLTNMMKATQIENTKTCDQILNDHVVLTNQLQNPTYSENSKTELQTEKITDEEEVYVEYNGKCLCRPCNFQIDKISWSNHKNTGYHLYKAWEHYRLGSEDKATHVCELCSKSHRDYHDWEAHINSSEHALNVKTVIEDKNPGIIRYCECIFCGQYMLDGLTHMNSQLHIDNNKRYYKYIATIK